MDDQIAGVINIKPKTLTTTAEISWYYFANCFFNEQLFRQPCKWK